MTHANEESLRPLEKASYDTAPVPPLPGYAYKPRAHIPTVLALVLHNGGTAPVRFDWHMVKGGYLGIHTNDIEEALAWAAEAREAGLTVSDVPGETPHPRGTRKSKLPPLRRIMMRGAGSSILICGHVCNTPHNPKTLRVRCTTCLPLVERLRYLKLKRT
jgi:hypothetical protein